VPPNVEAVVMRAMAKVRQARFDTATALADAYIDAVGGVAAVRGAQRRGMATRAMGGMKIGGSAPPPPMESAPETRPPEKAVQSDEVAGHLRLGTFSGLELPPEPLTPPAVPAAAQNVRTASMGAAQGAPIPDDPGAPIPARPERDDSWAAFAPTAAMPATRSPEEHLVAKTLPKTRASEVVSADIDAPRVPPTTAMEATSLADLEPPPPRQEKKGRGGKVLLVIAALLAGAASAAAVILGLHYYDQSRHDDAPAIEPEVAQPAPRTQGTRTAVAPPESREEEPTPTAPVEAQQEPAAAEQPASEPRTPAKRPRRTAPIDPLEDIRQVSHDPLREAQQALRGGNPARCIEILDEAIRTGAPAIVLRRRADCYEAAGRRDDAVRDYQRFCRLLPDHPAIGEVRPLLESWGRTCP
jgi:hypothetical protein